MPTYVMPAKTVSWNWGRGNDPKTVEIARVLYNGRDAGQITREADGTYNGFIEFRCVAGGELRKFEIETRDGYDDVNQCGNQLARMLHRKTTAAGFRWP